MKVRSLFAVAAIALAPLSVAGAQEQPLGVGGAAQSVFNWCMQLDTASVPECGCVAGFYAGYLDEQAFPLLAVVLSYSAPDGSVADQAGLQAAVKAQQEALGISDQHLAEIAAVFEQLDQVGKIADGICVPVENQALADGLISSTSRIRQ